MAPTSTIIARSRKASTTARHGSVSGTGVWLFNDAVQYRRLLDLTACRVAASAPCEAINSRQLSFPGGCRSTDLERPAAACDWSRLECGYFTYITVSIILPLAGIRNKPSIRRYVVSRTARSSRVCLIGGRSTLNQFYRPWTDGL